MNRNLSDGRSPFAPHHRTLLQATTVPIMNPRRALLAMLIASGYSLPAASAGCLDWLFCKSTPYPAPTAVGVAPAGSVTPLGPAVPVGPPVQAPSGFGQFPTQTAPYQAAMNPWATSQFNNPSVLSGMPVNPNAAQISGFRGVTPPPATLPAVTPTWWGSTAPQTSYNAAAAYQAPALVPPPATASGWSHPMQTTPLPPPGYEGGLFGKVWGNGYDTNVNNVPTTVYRPVQQIDPQTGQMVIVQQPCTTTTQQVQRTPYSTLQPAPVPAPQGYAGEPSCGRETPNYYAPGAVAPPATYAPPTSTAPPTGYAPPATNVLPPTGYASPPASYAPPTTVLPPAGYVAPPTTTYAPPTTSYPNGYGSGATGSGVTQATALDASPTPPGYGTGASNSLGVTLPPPPTQGSASGSYSAPTTNGYSGSSTSGSASGSTGSATSGSGSSGSGSTSSDASKVEQPRLESPPLSSNYNQGSAWGTPNTPSKSVSAKYSDLPPIPASDDYQPPAWNGSGTSGGTYPAGQQPASQTPRISPPSWNDRTAMRIGEPLRGPIEPAPAVTQASWQQSQPAPQSAPAPRANSQAEPRDDGGWVALPSTGR